MGHVDEIISIRFSYQCLQLIKKVSKIRGVKPGKLIQFITNNFVEVLDKCFKRRDMIVQRIEIRELYEKIPKKELDSWTANIFSKTLLCMKMFVPVLEFQKMTDAWMKFYEMNNHYLMYEDNNGWREFHCVTDMGYNWCYVYGNAYHKIFESNGFNVGKITISNDGFSFKVKIPTN